MMLPDLAVPAQRDLPRPRARASPSRSGARRSAAPPRSGRCSAAGSPPTSPGAGRSASTCRSASARHRRPAAPAPSPASRDRRSGDDWAGAVLSVLGFGGARLRPHRGPHATAGSTTGSRWTSAAGVAVGLSPVPVAFALAVLGLVAFVAGRAAPQRGGPAGPCSTSRSSRSPPSATATSLPLIVSLGEFGLLFALPLWLQNVSATAPSRPGWSSSRSPSAASWPAAGAVIGRTVPRSSSCGSAIVLEIVGIVGIALLAAARLAVVGHGAAALRLRAGRRLGDRAAHRRGARRRAGRAQRPGVAARRAPRADRLGLRHRRARHRPVHRAGRAPRRRPVDQGVPEQASTQIVDAVKGSAGAAIPGTGRRPRDRDGGRRRTHRLHRCHRAAAAR